MKKWIRMLAIVLLLLATGITANAWNEAGGEKDEALELTPDLENGRDVYEVCSGCHLPEGWGLKDGTFPQLSGQHAKVLIKQLADIREGNRDNPTMFPFALPRLASFWMKDTPQPLDLLFIAPDGTVSAVLSGKPDDETPISTGTPVIAVIEIAGGNAARLGISEGSRVRWGDCPPGAPRDPPGRIADPRRFCPH